MIQIKSLLTRLWRRLELVADDPGVDRDWASVSEVSAFQNAAREATPETRSPARNAPSARAPITD